MAGKLASYMDSFYFAAVIVKIIQKSTEKKGGVGTPPRPSSTSAHGPDRVLQSCLDSIFFRSLLPGVPRLILNPCLQMRQVPDPKKTYRTLLKTLLNQSCHTELFLTKLKTALDHKTEKVKF